MSLEARPQPIAVLAPPELTRPEPPLEAQRGAELLAARSPEEIRAMEAVFAHDSKDSAAAGALLNAWAGATVLHDVLKDAFAEPAGAVEGELKEKKKPDQ